MRRAAKCKFYIVQDDVRIGQFFMEQDRDHAFFKHFELKNRAGEKANAVQEDVTA